MEITVKMHLTFNGYWNEEKSIANYKSIHQSYILLIKAETFKNQKKYSKYRPSFSQNMPL